MSELPGDLEYTKEHEWLRKEQDGSVTIGITDHAQSALGDLVYVELPELEQDLEAGGEMAVVESVKAASDVYAPLTAPLSRLMKASRTTLKLSTRIPTAMAGLCACSPRPTATLRS
jgi:glycine cleavage system H protein